MAGRQELDRRRFIAAGIGGAAFAALPGWAGAQPLDTPVDAIVNRFMRAFEIPGIGIAIHTGSDDNFNRTDRIAFGSRVLFEPELGVGFRLSDRASLEASWVHMSHAQLFGRQNPGIDNIGARLSWKL